jgi:membrane protein DedA with SNARE-associated domain
VLTAVAAVLANTGLANTGLANTGLSGGQQLVLPGFLNSLSSPLEHYGLWAVLFFVLVEDFGIPVPGETILIAGAVFAGSGRLNVVAVGVVGFCAAVVGDNIGYAIGRFGGRALVERWGKYVFLTAERLDKAEKFFNRHGGKIIVVARFIEGLRQANGIIAGITEMRWLKFVAFNALGAALWVGTWVSAGYFAGEHIATIYTDITRYSLYAAAAAVVVIAAWIAVRVRRRRRSRRPAAAPAQDSAARTPENGTAPAAEHGTPAAAEHHTAAAAEHRSAPARAAGRGPADDAGPETAEAGPAATGAGEPTGAPGTRIRWPGVAVKTEPRGTGPQAADGSQDDSANS